MSLKSTKKSIHFTILILISYLVFLSSYVEFVSRDDDSVAHLRCMRALKAQIIPKIEKEFGVVCVGGGGEQSEQISTVDVTFKTNRRASIEEARELHVRCTERLRESINQDVAIRPHLIEYPFPSSRIYVSIGFEPGPGRYFSDGSVEYVLQGKGSIHYCSDHPLSRRYQDLLSEPYDEALTIVKKSTKTSADLRTHEAKPYEADLDSLLSDVCKEVKRKWGLKPIKSGGDMSDGIKHFAFLFHKYRKKVQVEEARNMELDILDLLVRRINANEKVRPYLVRLPIQIEDLQLKIEFQRKFDCPQEGEDRLSAVTWQNGELRYQMQEPMKNGVQLLDPVLVHHETLDAARAAVKEKISTPARWLVFQ